MSEPSSIPLDELLQRVATTGDAPWYPRDYAEANDIPRDSLDTPLDRLRHAGLIRFTDWVAGKGQGLVATPEGLDVLQSPRELDRLRRGMVPDRRPVEVPNVDDALATRSELAARSLLDPRTPVVTNTLIAVNCFVFLLGILVARQANAVDEYLSGQGDEVSRIIRDLGAVNTKDLYVHHQWWRLITCCFVHIGFGHLVLNMLSLFILGRLAERIWGGPRYLILYMISGFCGSCGMMVELSHTGGGGGAGASGAIFGIFLSLFTWLFLHRYALPPGMVNAWQTQLFLGLLLMLYLTFDSERVTRGGHVGGGLAGLFISFPLDYLRFGSIVQKIGACVALSVMPAATFAATMQFPPPQLKAIHRLTQEMLKPYYDAKEQAILDTYNKKILPLVKMDPDDRVEGKVREALASIAESEQRIEEQLKIWTDQPPFPRPYESIRTSGIDVLREIQTILDVCRRLLESPSDQRQLHRELERELQKLNQLEKRWDEAFRM